MQISVFSAPGVQRVAQKGMEIVQSAKATSGPPSFCKGQMSNSFTLVATFFQPGLRINKKVFR